MLVATNSTPNAMRIEIEIETSGTNFRTTEELGQRGTRRVWAVEVPAHGEMRLGYLI